MKSILSSFAACVALVCLQSCADSYVTPSAPAYSFSDGNSMFLGGGSVSNSPISGLRSGDTAITRDSVNFFLNKPKAFKPNNELVKTGSMSVDVKDIKVATETVENSVKQSGGYITSMNERLAGYKHARYQIRVPAAKLKQTMASFADLGVVRSSNVSVDDVTAVKVRREARLKELMLRRGRMLKLLKQAKTVKEKLDVEERLAKIEAEILQIQVAAREQSKHAKFSKLDLSLSLKSIDGPIGAAWNGVKWGVGKLFVIRD